ncbi:MAG TPA: 5'-nucleotidase C-terminal domain-containing protein, partial [Ramlibacter sp.]|nr:5'-nucleotidase C-terminal domain-containing protein [Ramlibacter sp.]
TAAAMAMLLSGCLSTAPTEPLDLTILHINDHHSHLDAESTRLQLRNAAGVKEGVTVELGGFARVTSAIEALAAGQANVLRLHAGDALTGDLYSTLDEGRSDAALMNTVCFDAFALGNHEFDRGDAALARFIGYLQNDNPDCRTPVLSANLKPRANSPLVTPDSLVKPSVVLMRSGHRIGIIGLTIAGKTTNGSQPDAGTTFEDEAIAAQREIDALRSQGIARIVLLTHYTYAGDRAIASRLSGVDVIVGGDSHSLLGPESLKGYGFTPEGAYPTQATDRDGRAVCIAQAWQYAYALGELRVRFDAQGHVTQCGGQTHLLIGDALLRGDGSTPQGADEAAMRADIAAEKTLRVTAPSAAALASLAPFRAAKDAFGNRPAGVAAETFCLRRVPGPTRDPIRSTLGSACNLSPRVIAHGGDAQQLVAQAYLERAQAFGGADVSLINGGGVRIDLPGQDLFSDPLITSVTVNTAYTQLPFRNTMVRLTVTGAELVAALEDSLDYLLRSSGVTGAYPYAANLRFRVDLQQPRGSRLSAIERKNAQGLWAPLDPAATLKLITSSYLAGGGDGYATLKGVTGARREDTYLDEAEQFVQFVRARSPLFRVPLPDYSTQQFTD